MLEAERLGMPRRLSLRARLVLGVHRARRAGLAAAEHRDLRVAALVPPRAHRRLARPSPRTALERAARPRPVPRRPRPGAGLRRRIRATTSRFATTDGGRALRRRPGDALRRGCACTAADLPPTVEVGQGDGGPRARATSRRRHDGGERYRVRASTGGRLRGDPDRRDVRWPTSTRRSHRLLVVMLLVTVVVLVALAALGLWVVRLGLRPLDGDRGARPARSPPATSRSASSARSRDTEVGRLGLALNTMLGRIEASFRAQEASERKLRRFVADASHELRTPLAAVRAYAELFTRGADRRPDDLERSMTGITRESERMSLLVEDLLLLARLDEGRPLEREPVRARRGRLARPSRRRGRSSPSGRSSLEVAPAVVLGDRDRLRQIVDNLLSNVRAHTPPETPVTVRLASAERRRRDRGRGPGPRALGRGRPSASSSASTAPTSRAPARAAASGSACRSSPPSPRRTAAPSPRASEPGKRTTFTITLPLAKPNGSEEER